VQIPSATSERAVGVERFEDAIVQASILTPKKDLRMGEEFELRIELVNAGSKIARIMRIEDAVPDSLELRQNPTMYNAEGSALNPGGKKLDPLKTESVVLILKPTRQGRVRLMPRVIYLAESGKQLITSSDPVDLTVSIESGSKPEAVQVFRPQRKFLIETEESERVFVYLAAEFSRDYRERRLYIEKAGWRSLMDLVRDLSLPKRALYGDGAHRGRIVKELEDRGLIETRVFPDERGRGGKVRRVRVAYQNDIVKKYVDDQPTSRLGLI